MSDTLTPPQPSDNPERNNIPTAEEQPWYRSRAAQMSGAFVGGIAVLGTALAIAGGRSSEKPAQEGTVAAQIDTGAAGEEGSYDGELSMEAMLSMSYQEGMENLTTDQRISVAHELLKSEESFEFVEVSEDSDYETVVTYINDYMLLASLNDDPRALWAIARGDALEILSEDLVNGNAEALTTDAANILGSIKDLEASTTDRWVIITDFNEDNTIIHTMDIVFENGTAFVE